VEIYTTFTTVDASVLGVASGVPAHERSGLPMFGAGAGAVCPTPAVWQRPMVDATAAVRPYALTTIKRNAVAGVRPGLRSTSPPV
jgi:hypothetical protein